MAEGVIWERDPVTGNVAAFDPSGPYRYVLTRTWRPEPPAVFIMLNPSGTSTKDQGKTRHRCLTFAKDWGYGGLVTVNLFALVSKDRNALDQHPDPVGERNDQFILHYCTWPDALVVAAWGDYRPLHGRDDDVTGLLRDNEVPVSCLGETQAGAPCNPLYLAKDTPLVPYPAR